MASPPSFRAGRSRSAAKRRLIGGKATAAYVTLHFCPRCGSTVFWEAARKPEMIAVAVGAFADPEFPAPAKQVYSQHRHPWVTVPVD